MSGEHRPDSVAMWRRRDHDGRQPGDEPFAQELADNLRE